MSYIDDIMGFDPTNLEAFQEPTSTSNFNENIYKTNPLKYSKSEDGHYRSIVKIIYNPLDVRKSIIKQENYFIQDAEGSLLVRSKLSNDDRECPIFKAWKKLWFSNDEDKKNWAKQMFDKSSSQWVLVQVLEDENQPELVGKILAWKLPKTIFTKMSAKMNPSPESKKAPVAIMDYLIGNPLEIDVAPGPDDPAQPERRQREINYDLCEFSGDYAPIIKVDGTPLFDDNELEIIENFVTAKANITKAKSNAKKEEAEKALEELKPQMRDLYSKAIEYLKENSFDIVKECGYNEWDEETTRRVMAWIESVSQMRDPKSTSTPATQATSTFEAQVPQNIPADPIAEMMGDDLPF